jgi:hypothetical protein
MDASALGPDPWQDSPVECVAYPRTPAFLKLLQEVLGDDVPLVNGLDARHDQVVLVDCREIVEGMALARQRYAVQPLVGVIASPDSATIIQILAAGADGVISVTEPLATWRECLNVVRGGARWLQGPALQVNLETKYASYGIAKRERHDGDITMRTKLFAKSHIADKFRG